MAKTKEQLLNILDQFQLTEKVVSAEPFGNGHINDTLKVTNEKGEIKYVLQRINHLIFTNVDMLQNNIQIVTSHIRKKLEEKGENDIDRKVLTFLPTKDNKLRSCPYAPRVPSQRRGGAAHTAPRDSPGRPRHGPYARRNAQPYRFPRGCPGSRNAIR